MTLFPPSVSGAGRIDAPAEAASVAERPVAASAPRGGAPAAGTAAAPVEIQADDLRKAYRRGGTVALDGCSLRVPAREIVCVIGPSGCGKTTLLRIIAGLIRADGGRVRVGGAEVTQPRRDVAVVFQHFGLFPWKSVYDNVAYGLRVHGRPEPLLREAVAHHIALVGLGGFEASYPYQLSGGMQQRVGLARALAISPAVLLMDEPFGSLDAQTRELMQEELLRLWRMQPKTMLFVTHSIDEAILLGDRIAVMTGRPGRIMEMLDVDIARPRDADAIRRSSRYLDLRAHVWDRLKREVGRPPGGAP